MTKTITEIMIGTMKTLKATTGILKLRTLALHGDIKNYSATSTLVLLTEDLTQSMKNSKAKYLSLQHVKKEETDLTTTALTLQGL